MKTDEEFIEYEYDDDECLELIRQRTASDEALSALSDDEIVYLVDLFYDYMETIDLPEESSDDEFEVDLEELYKYVCTNIRRDEMPIELSQEQVAILFDAESEYADTLFDEEESDE